MRRDTADASHTSGDFLPTREAALLRLAAVRPDHYARTRNALDGAVTRLSPYFSHGLLTLPEAHAAIAALHRLNPQHKLVYEFGWREYFHHVWSHRGDGIFKSLHDGPLPEDAYARELPADIRGGRTGIPVIDHAVQTLYATGYLHNHVRMWLASYVVHLRKVHWRVGADWLYSHLLDGDLASNHLSWQWVAGTASHKPYLFNAENVAKYAPIEWHSPNTPIDTTYEALDQMARRPGSICVMADADGVEEPELRHAPGETSSFTTPDASSVANHDVWLVHPWSLGDTPIDLPENTLLVAIIITGWHDQWPWSNRRWNFVTTRQRELASLCWLGNTDELCAGLVQARSVSAIDDPHYSEKLHRLHDDIVLRPAPRLFDSVAPVCDSFSQWWRQLRLTSPDVDTHPPA